MLNLTKKLTLTVAIVVGITTALSSCGSKDEAAAPAPAPTTPVAPPPPGPNTPVPPPSNSIVPGTNCPSIAGDRHLNQNGQPFYGQLQGSNSLTFSIFTSQYSNYASPSQNIVAAGQFTFPDISYFIGGQVQMNYNICLSSMGFNNSPATQGTLGAYHPYYGSPISLPVRGYVDYPLSFAQPYGYPNTYYAPGSTTPTYGKQTIEMQIGNGMNCQAFIKDGRIVGCIEVQIGQQQRFFMQSR